MNLRTDLPKKPGVPACDSERLINSTAVKR